MTSGKSETITVLGCGNASGNSIPPYIIFKGKKMQTRWMDGSTPGAVGTVSDSGWSNSQIFLSYLQEHFLSYIQGRNEKVLLLLDGHKSHVSIPVIDWALENNIILHILPAHTSHFLQPMDVGVYGPFQKIYDNLCHKKTRSSTCVIIKDEISEIICNAYLKSATPENLQSAFRKTGIFPLNRGTIDDRQLAPAKVFETEVSVEPDVREDCSENLECESLLSDNVVQERDEGSRVADEAVENESDFFVSRMQKVKRVKSERVIKPRKTLSKVVSGRAITEDEVAEKVREHVRQQGKRVREDEGLEKESSCSKRSRSSGKKKTSSEIKSKRGKGKKSNRSSSPQPGPSHIYISDIDSDDEESQIQESDKCCVCKQFTPDVVKNSVSLIIVKWAQCDRCKHWVHLVYCTDVRVVRRGAEFKCVHCKEFE